MILSGDAQSLSHEEFVDVFQVVRSLKCTGGGSVLSRDAMEAVSFFYFVKRSGWTGSGFCSGGGCVTCLLGSASFALFRYFDFLSRMNHIRRCLDFVGFGHLVKGAFVAAGDLVEGVAFFDFIGFERVRLSHPRTSNQKKTGEKQQSQSTG